MKDTYSREEAIQLIINFNLVNGNWGKINNFKEMQDLLINERERVLKFLEEDITIEKLFKGQTE